MPISSCCVSIYSKPLKKWSVYDKSVLPVHIFINTPSVFNSRWVFNSYFLLHFVYYY
jgi:hypothetical protein